MAVRQPQQRDYEDEMIAAVTRAIPKGDYVAGTVADKLVRRLQVEDLDLLTGYLLARARGILTDLIDLNDRRQRQDSRQRAIREAVETGSFQAVHVVNKENERRRVADMTGADHRFVARGYEGSAKRVATLAAFHRAIAKRIDGRRTSDVLTEEQYDTLYRSITGE